MIEPYTGFVLSSRNDSLDVVLSNLRWKAKPAVVGMVVRISNGLKSMPIFHFFNRTSKSKLKTRSCRKLETLDLVLEQHIFVLVYNATIT